MLSMNKETFVNLFSSFLSRFLSKDNIAVEDDTVVGLEHWYSYNTRENSLGMNI